MEQLQTQIIELRSLLNDRDEQISQLRIEAIGAAEAVTAAQQAANEARSLARVANMQQSGNQHIEGILKTLQTPQIIRDLPSFDGNPIKLFTFLRAIDNLMPLLQSAQNTPVYNIWLQAIRGKIQGEADNVLELYGTNLDWNEIKGNLITHYSDRRDEVCLGRDMYKLEQTTTVEDFYGKVSHIISLLVNLINLNTSNELVKAEKIRLYQDMGLKVFLGGLKDPLGPIIRAQTPTTLKEALRLCLEEGNYSHARHLHKFPPLIPPKKMFPQTQQPRYFQPTVQPPPFRFTQQPRLFQPPQSRPFQPPRPNQFPQNKPFPFQQQQRQFPYPQQRPFFNPQPRPFLNSQTKPIPMEVDSSIRSRQINYTNRPHFQIEKVSDNDEDYYADRNEYYQQMYDPYDQPYHHESTAQTVETDVSTMENSVAKTDEKDKPNVDDLNFQLADEVEGTT